MQNCCRKCMVSLKNLWRADSYDDIDAKYFESRTNESLKEDFSEAEALGVKHVNGMNQPILSKVEYGNAGCGISNRGYKIRQFFA